MAKVTKDFRKSMKIRPSGRSSDYISPSFGYGCLLNCTYCYMKRHKPEGLSVATNIHTILTAIDHHAMFDTIEKPNQTDPEYITYDISCNEDFALHAKYYDWIKIFDFFKDHPRAKATFATKIIPLDFLKYNPNGKVRIRMSLMPQIHSTQLEPNTAKIIDRIKAINNFIEAGYDVHVNFSPVIITRHFVEEYGGLFQVLDTFVKDEHKDKVKAEVIFLTHNRDKHEYNVANKLPGEYLLWQPEVQEDKVSQYGGNNLRYNHVLKAGFINHFKRLHNAVVSWNTIRYIF